MVEMWCGKAKVTRDPVTPSIVIISGCEFAAQEGIEYRCVVDPQPRDPKNLNCMPDYTMG